MKSRPGCVYDSPVIFNIFHFFFFFSPRSRRNNLLYHFYFTLLQKQRGSFDTDNDDDNGEELCVPTLDRRIQMRMWKDERATNYDLVRNHREAFIVSRTNVGKYK